MYIKYLKNNKKLIGIVLFIIVCIIIYVILVRTEKFENLSLPEDKLLMITDSSGNIETLPIESIYKYLKSIETEVSDNKTNTTTYLKNLTNVTSNIDDIKNNIIKKNTKYNVKIGSNFNTTTLFN